MVARMAYELFLKKVGGELHDGMDGNKKTLSTMRKIMFEKRNSSLQLNHNNNFLLTLKDSNGTEIEKRIKQQLEVMSHDGKNKVLWWKNRGLELAFESQY